MVLAATALTDDANDQHGLGLEPTMIRLAPFVWSNGGELFDDPDNPTGFALDSPQTLDAMQDFLDLGIHNPPIPDDEDVEAEDLESRFLNGRLAMLLSSRRSTPTFRTITDFDWDIAPLPMHTQPAGILHSDAYCMTRASGAKDAAWRFVEYALGPEGRRSWPSGRTVPSLIEVANSEAFLDPTPGSELAGLPRHHPVHPPGSEHLHWPRSSAAEPMLGRPSTAAYPPSSGPADHGRHGRPSSPRRALSRPVFRDAERRGLLLLLMPYLAGLIGLIGIPAAFTMVMSLFERPRALAGVRGAGQLRRAGRRPDLPRRPVELPALVLIAVPLRLPVPWPWSAAA